MEYSSHDVMDSQAPPPAGYAATVMADERPLHRWLVHVARCLGVLSGLIGAAVFAGWMLGVSPVYDATSVITMKTNTALATLFAGAALVLLIPEQVGLGRRWVGRICAAVVLILGALTFCEHLLGWDLRIDQLLATELPGAAGVTSPNRMGPPASLSFLLLGSALLFLSCRWTRAERATLHQSLALIVTLVALLSTLGYLYGVNELYGIARYTGIAWPTAVAILILGLGVLCAQPEKGLMAAVTANDPGGRTIRRLLLPMILLPLALGWVRLAGERYGLYEAALGTAMMMLIFIVMFSVLVYYAGRGVSQSAAVIEQQKQLLEVTLASIGDGVIVTDTQGRVTFLNGEAERLTGWTSAQAKGRPLPAVFQIINEQTRQPVENPVEKVFRLGRAVGLANHTILIAKDGREIPIDDSGAPIRQNDGTVQGVVLVFRDFTEQKRAEEDIRRSHDLLQAIIDNTPALVYVKDMEGRITVANQPLGEAVGMDAHGILGKTSREFMADSKDADIHMANDQWVIETGQAITTEESSRGRVFLSLKFPLRDAQRRIFATGGVSTDITDRKRAEEALRESERRLRTLGDQIPGGAIYQFVQRPDGRMNYAYVSAGIERLFGISADYVTANPDAFRQLIVEEDRGRVAAAEEQSARDSTPFDCEFRQHTVAGEVKWVQCRSTPRRLEDGSILWDGIVVDITERKQAEKALRQSERRVRLKLKSILSPEGDIGNLDLADIIDVSAMQSLMDHFYDVAHIPMAIIDLQGKVLVGVGWQEVCTKFHRIHPETCKHCIDSDTQLSAGVAPGEFKLYRCKNNMWDVATPIMVGDQQVGNLFTGQFFFDDEPLDYELFRSQAHRYGFEERSYLAALDAVPRLSRMTVDAGMGFFTHLAQMLSLLSYSNIKLARSMTESQRQKDLLAVTLASIGDAVIVTDSQGQVTFLNNEAERLTGWTNGEAHGRPLPAVFHIINEQTRQPVENPVEKVFRLGTAVGLANHTILVTKDGREIPIDDSGAPIRQNDGTVQGVVLVFRDFTEQKQAAEILQRAKADAEVANEAKSRFVANISHELRTPMNAILGMVDLALRKTTETTARDFLSTARESADLLLALLNDLLDSAKIESGKMELESAPFSLRGVLGLTTQVLGVRASEKGILFSCRIASDVPDALVGDQVRLRQVLLNLAGNGIKFTERGEVTVSVRVESQDAQEAHLEFAVRDTGIGIPESELASIFHPFSQTDTSTTRRFGGTGLGLSISSSLADMMGGRIRVESELGKGSTFSFTVRLPLAKELPAEPETRIETSDMAASMLRILLVEDNPANQKLATYILQERGHAVEIAGDGREAMRMAQQNGYDVILMDVQMPGIDGLEATKAIRDRDNGQRRVPIVAMTAHAMKGDRERCLAAGMDGYLSKPIDGHEMIALVESFAAGTAVDVSAPVVLTSVVRESASLPNAAVFDRELALKRCLNKPDLLQQMIAFFVKDADTLLPQIRAALQMGDLLEVGRLGHRLKGTLTHIGAEAARDAAQRVERFLLSAGEQVEAQDAVRALEHQCEVLKSELISKSPHDVT